MTGPDLLATFLTERQISQKDAAEALHVTRVTMWTWLNRKAVPSEIMRVDIETWTSGVVPRDAWGPLPDKRRQKDAPPVEPYDPEAAE